VRAPTDPEDCLFPEADVSKVYNQVNICKAVGPDSIPGRVLRALTDQLAGKFTVMFNLSLSQSVLPPFLLLRILRLRATMTTAL
jgi:ABC-type phosphonate transport system ATPase subunit